MSRARDTANTQDNIGGAVAPLVAGKNAVLNSNFSVWQRGTSIALAAASGTLYVADRWCTSTNANQACTVSRQATGDTTNLPNIQYALRYQRNSGQTGTTGIYFVQNFETINSIPFVGKTVTMSFYARAGANFSATSNALAYNLTQGTGTDQNAFGGYTGGSAVVSGTATLTTSWQRFSATGTVSASTTELCPQFIFNPTGTAGTNDYYEVTGVQLEVGSVATPYAPNGATYQAELAACQRYLPAFTTSASGTLVGGYAYALNSAIYCFPLPVNARVAPTGITLTGNFEAFGLNTAYSVTPAFNGGTITTGTVIATTGLTITAGQGSRLSTNGAATMLFTGCEL
jgi:hypothetical protein